MRTISLPTLVLQSLVHYRRSHIAVAAGTAVATVVLTGALLIGDSLRGSLQALTDNRLGSTEHVVMSQEGFIRSALSDSLAKELNATTAPILQRAATVSTDGGRRQANRSFIIGVDDRFRAMGPSEIRPSPASDGEAVVNRSLARKLGVAGGDQILVRFERGDLLPLEAPFSGGERNRASLRLTIASIIDSDAFGDFSLKAEHYAVYNIFVPLEVLAKACGIPGEAGAILVDGAAPDSIERVLGRNWSLDDAGVRVRGVANGAEWEVHIDNVFIDSSLSVSIQEAFPTARPVFAYFVNALALGDRATPYSFVSTPPTPISLRDNELLLSRWAAEDLDAEVGDTVSLRYFVPREPSGLEEDTAAFVVSRIVPTAPPWTDSTLMPAFPGLADAGSCTEWDPGTPIDLDLIRTKDEAYWDRWRGTPKAFVNISAAQRMWANRFGTCTAVRFPAAGLPKDTVEKRLAGTFSPDAVGLLVHPIRASIEQAVSQGISFAPLFTGLSFFLIAAAVILTTLLFGFGVQSRRRHYTFLVAAGFRRRRVVQVFLFEALAVALVGALAGAALSPVYTAMLLAALQTIWHAAAQTPVLGFHFQWSSPVVGILTTLAIAGGAMWVSVRMHTAKLYLRRMRVSRPKRVSRLWYAVVVICGAGAVALIVPSGSATGRDAAGVFFGAGALLLIALLTVWHILLDRRVNGHSTEALGLWGLVLGNVARRKGRSTATAAVFACALFVLGGVSAFRHGRIADPRERSSGTGGFWWYGESMDGVSRDDVEELLHTELDTGSGIVPMRLREGDDASCFNLNRVGTPPLVGLQPSVLDSLGSFSFVSLSESAQSDSPWAILDRRLGENVVPAVADQSVMEWGLGKGVGDTLYFANEKGEPLRAVLVGGLSNSVFQGKVLIAEKQFVNHYPSTDGYRLFLVDSPPGTEKRTARALRTRFQNDGLDLEPAAERLASFNRVENTYLSIFSILGTLGFVLGSFGLVVVLLRNALERRYELALLSAQGFRKRMVHRLIFREHALLCGAGLFAGLVSSLIAIAPSVIFSGERVALSALVTTIALVVAFVVPALWFAASAVVSRVSPGLLREDEGE